MARGVAVSEKPLDPQTSGYELPSGSLWWTIPPAHGRPERLGVLFSPDVAPNPVTTYVPVPTLTPGSLQVLQRTPNGHPQWMLLFAGEPVWDDDGAVRLAATSKSRGAPPLVDMSTGELVP
jgi:hypothetical protein